MALHPDIQKYYVFRALLKRFILPIIVIYGLDQGLSLTELSVIAAAGTAISFLLEIPSGAVADALGHRRALLLSMLGQAISMVLYVGGTFEWMCLATVFYFGSGTLMTGTSEAFFFERVKALGLEAQHAKLYGQGKGFATAASVISMIGAGIAYEFAWYLPFVIGAVQYILAACVIAWIRPAPNVVSVSEEEGLVSPLTHMRDAWGQVKQQPRVFWLTVTSAIVIGPLFALADFQQAVMQDVGMTVAVIGFVYAFKRFLSVWIQGYTYVIMNRLSPVRFVSLCMIAMWVSFLMTGLVRTPALVIVALTIGTLSWVGLEVAINDYLNRRVETRSRATMLSISNFARTIIQLIVALTFAGVTLFTNAAGAYVIVGIMLVVIGAPPLFMLNRSFARAA